MIEPQHSLLFIASPVSGGCMRFRELPAGTCLNVTYSSRRTRNVGAFVEIDGMAGHCVLNLNDLAMLYQGSDAAKAAAAAVEGTHWAEAPTICAAIFRCADEVGHVRRGVLEARTSRSAPLSGALTTSGAT